MMRKSYLLTAATLIASLHGVAFAACNNMHVEFHDVYARVLDDNPTGEIAVYMKMVNKDTIEHTIVDVSSPGSDSANFYSYGDDVPSNVIDKAPIGELVLPPGGVYALSPGHAHVLLDYYATHPDVGDTLTLIFTLADNCHLKIDNVPVAE